MPLSDLKTKLDVISFDYKYTTYKKKQDLQLFSAPVLIA